MKKFIFISLILGLVLMPGLVSADPGLLDQSGGHICLKNCGLYGLTDGQYHYHEIPMCPAYYSGDIKKPSYSHLFYLPEIKTEEMTNLQITIDGQLNDLTHNPLIDDRFCEGSEVFAQGWYDNLNRARVKPVCLNSESVVKGNSALTRDDYYQEIPDPTTEINKVYHVMFLNDGKKVYTDQPAISELANKIVQGATDPTMYYIYRYDEPMTLRPVSIEKAKFYGGDDYASRILYFDDSIIYSYPIGKPLY